MKQSIQTKPLEVTKSRQADYKLLSIGSKFRVATNEDILGTCGNIQNLVDDTALEGTKWEDSFRGSVAAPYLLARLCAMFNGLVITTGGQEFYKTTWQTVLIHEETGFKITFYDYKGCASFGSDVIEDTKETKPFLKDSLRH